MSKLIQFFEKTDSKVAEYRVCKWTGEKFPIFEKDVAMLSKLSPTI
jgi:hypothetical protein